MLDNVDWALISIKRIEGDTVKVCYTVRSTLQLDDLQKQLPDLEVLHVNPSKRAMEKCRDRYYKIADICKYEKIKFSNC